MPRRKPDRSSRAVNEPREAVMSTVRDTGCQLAPRCLECPLPECWFAVPPATRLAVLTRLRREMRRERERAQRAQRTDGVPLPTV